MYSSSYIIGVNGALTSDKVEQAIGVTLLSPYSEMADEIVNYIVKYAKKYTVREYMDTTHTEEYKLPDEIRYIVVNNMDLYYGEINSKQDLKPGVLAFIAMGVNYKSDKFIFKTEAYE